MSQNGIISKYIKETRCGERKLKGGERGVLNGGNRNHGRGKELGVEVSKNSLDKTVYVFRADLSG